VSCKRSATRAASSHAPRAGACAWACSARARPASRISSRSWRATTAVRCKARFADKTYDFLRDINPPGNRESTGLVTRFGLGPERPSRPISPVRVRLLTQTDIVKILGNSFLLDFDHQKAAFERPDGHGDPQAPE